MTTSLIVHLLSSLVIGGAFIAACSLAAEVFGPHIGGIVAGLPSTVVITLFFVAWTESPARAVQETTFIPFALGLNCLLLGVYGLVARWGAVVALIVALATWVALATCAVLWAPDQLAASLVALAVCFAVGSWMLSLAGTPGTVSGNAVQPGLVAILARASFGGAVIALGVCLSQLAGPLVGGVAAVFPATGVSTLVIVSWSRGSRFSLGLLRPMMVSGSVTILVYTLVVRYSYPSLGIIGGTVAALFLSAVSAYAIYRSGSVSSLPLSKGELEGVNSQ
jgi:hypothetical protein